jgi:hypothetical protein
MLYGCERALQEHHSGVLVVGEGGLPVAGVVAALANRCHHQLRSVRLAADVVVAVLVVVAAGIAEHHAATSSFLHVLFCNQHACNQRVASDLPLFSFQMAASIWFITPA